jgi:hypothetical protein
MDVPSNAFLVCSAAIVNAMKGLEKSSLVFIPSYPIFSTQPALSGILPKSSLGIPLKTFISILHTGG